MTDPWVAFITARLGEWEALARTDKSAPAGTIRFVDSDSWSEPLVMEFGADFVLGMVAALRAVIADHGYQMRGRRASCSRCSYGNSLGASWPCTTVRALAGIWGGHQEYAVLAKLIG